MRAHPALAKSWTGRPGVNEMGEACTEISFEDWRFRAKLGLCTGSGRCLSGSVLRGPLPRVVG